MTTGRTEDHMWRLFSYYALKVSSKDLQYMRTTTLHKLLHQAQFIHSPTKSTAEESNAKRFSVQEIDIITASVRKRNKTVHGVQSKLSYRAFLSVLWILGLQSYPTLEPINAFRVIQNQIQEHLTPDWPPATFLASEEDLDPILSSPVFQKAFAQIFQHYTRSSKLRTVKKLGLKSTVKGERQTIDYQDFLLFGQNFGLVLPGMLSRLELGIFFCFNVSKPNSHSGSRSLSFHGFCKVLMMVAATLYPVQQQRSGPGNQIKALMLMMTRAIEIQLPEQRLKPLAKRTNYSLASEHGKYHTSMYGADMFMCAFNKMWKAENLRDYFAPFEPPPPSVHEWIIRQSQQRQDEKPLARKDETLHLRTLELPWEPLDLLHIVQKTTTTTKKMNVLPPPAPYASS